MNDLCMNCNENAIDTLEIYCPHCALEMYAELMQYETELDNLWTTAEAK